MDILNRLKKLFKRAEKPVEEPKTVDLRTKLEELFKLKLKDAESNGEPVAESTPEATTEPEPTTSEAVQAVEKLKGTFTLERQVAKIEELMQEPVTTKVTEEDHPPKTPEAPEEPQVCEFCGEDCAKGVVKDGVYSKFCYSQKVKLLSEMWTTIKWDSRARYDVMVPGIGTEPSSLRVEWNDFTFLPNETSSFVKIQNDWELPEVPVVGDDFITPILFRGELLRMKTVANRVKQSLKHYDLEEQQAWLESVFEVINKLDVDSKTNKDKYGLAPRYNIWSGKSRGKGPQVFQRTSKFKEVPPLNQKRAEEVTSIVTNTEPDKKEKPKQ